MSVKFDDIESATPIDADDLSYLKHHIQLQSELNQLESENIRRGHRWALKSRKLKKDLISIPGLCLLHKEMFGDVWGWAGKFRTTLKNIGIAPELIAEELHKLCADVQFWIEHETYDWDEIAIRFHHRLVYIHPFHNGNGRHARQAADLLLIYNSKQRLPWGDDELSAQSELRSAYIKSLRKADSGEYQALIKFAKGK